MFDSVIVSSSVKEWLHWSLYWNIPLHPRPKLDWWLKVFWRIFRDNPHCSPFHLHYLKHQCCWQQNSHWAQDSNIHFWQEQCWDSRSHFLTSKHIWPWFHRQLQLTLKMMSLLQHLSSWTWISVALIQYRLDFWWILIDSWQCRQIQVCYVFNNFLSKHVGLKNERWWLFVNSIFVVSAVVIVCFKHPILKSE